MLSQFPTTSWNIVRNCTILRSNTMVCFNFPIHTGAEWKLWPPGPLILRGGLSTIVGRIKARIMMTNMQIATIMTCGYSSWSLKIEDRRFKPQLVPSEISKFMCDALCVLPTPYDNTGVMIYMYEFMCEINYDLYSKMLVIFKQHYFFFRSHRTRPGSSLTSIYGTPCR